LIVLPGSLAEGCLGNAMYRKRSVSFFMLLSLLDEGMSLAEPWK
jgi:hypothetical protein